MYFCHNPFNEVMNFQHYSLLSNNAKKFWPLLVKGARSNKLPMLYSKEQQQCLIDDIEFCKYLMTKTKFHIVHTMEGEECFFRAVAFQIYNNEEYHVMVRFQCAIYMLLNDWYFSIYITEPFHKVVKNMCSSSATVNAVIIEAVSNLYRRKMEIYSFNPDYGKVPGAIPVKYDLVYPVFSNMVPLSVAYNTRIVLPCDTPIRLSVHMGKHYNSVIEKSSLQILKNPTNQNSEERSSSEVSMEGPEVREENASSNDN